MSLFTFLCFLTLYSLLQTDSASSSLSYYCTTDGNFTTNDTLDLNSKELFGYFNYEIGNDQREFALGSKDHGPGRVHGIALRRLGGRLQELHRAARCSKEAVMLYGNCKYTNWSFFGKVEDYQLRVSFCSEQNVCGTAAADFDRARAPLLNNTAAEIIWTPRMLATGELQVDGDTRLYGLAQCTRDLSNDDCQRCIDVAVSKTQFCAGKQGGRVLAESCSIRYEVYKFYT